MANGPTKSFAPSGLRAEDDTRRASSRRGGSRGGGARPDLASCSASGGANTRRVLHLTRRQSANDVNRARDSGRADGGGAAGARARPPTRSSRSSRPPRRPARRSPCVQEQRARQPSRVVYAYHESLPRRARIGERRPPRGGSLAEAHARLDDDVDQPRAAPSVPPAPSAWRALQPIFSRVTRRSKQRTAPRRRFRRKRRAREAVQRLRARVPAALAPSAGASGDSSRGDRRGAHRASRERWPARSAARVARRARTASSSRRSKPARDDIRDARATAD